MLDHPKYPFDLCAYFAPLRLCLRQGFGRQVCGEKFSIRKTYLAPRNPIS
jgi:hypothetical protein